MKSLTDSVKDYLAICRSLGYELKESGKLLNQFIYFLMEKNENHITITSALEWAMKPKNVTLAWWSQRLSIVRSFARYHQTEDQKTQIPPTHLLSYHPCRAQPYIYSDEEISQLLRACLSLPSHGLREQTYFTFFGLMVVTGCRNMIFVFLLVVYSMGLRLDEALSLQVSDIDADRSMIHIRRGKGAKDRMLPLPDLTLKALRTLWTKHRHPYLLFPNPVGSPERIAQAKTHMDKGGAQQAMKRVVEECGIKKKCQFIIYVIMPTT